jgi:hypothetical protein
LCLPSVPQTDKKISQAKKPFRNVGGAFLNFKSLTVNVEKRSFTAADGKSSARYRCRLLYGLSQDEHVTITSCGAERAADDSVPQSRGNHFFV